MGIKILKHSRLLLCLLFISILYLFAHLTGIKDHFSSEYIRSIFFEYGLYSWLVYIILFTIGNLLQIPGWIFLSASILAIGSIQAFILNLIAAYVSCAISFILIRFIGNDSLTQLENKWAKNLLKVIHQKPIKVNILLRLLFQTAPPLNYSLALSGIKFRDYFLGAILGLPVPVLIYTIVITFISNKI